jgi:hypothetical protein
VNSRNFHTFNRVFHKREGLFPSAFVENPFYFLYTCFLSGRASHRIWRIKGPKGGGNLPYLEKKALSTPYMGESGGKGRGLHSPEYRLPAMATIAIKAISAAGGTEGCR